MFVSPDSAVRGRTGRYGVLAAAVTVAAVGRADPALFAESRRGRRTLAVLSVLGASPRSLGRLVRAHALLVVAASMLVGCVVGVVLGRLAWSATAHSVGVLPGHVLPLLRIALAVIAAFLLGCLAAWWPARSALRSKPAAVLRAE